MALRFLESCETYFSNIDEDGVVDGDGILRKWDSYTSSGSWTQWSMDNEWEGKNPDNQIFTVDCWGYSGLHWNRLEKVLDSQSTWIMGFRFGPTSWMDWQNNNPDIDIDATIACLMDGSTVQVTLGLDEGGHLKVWRGTPTSGTLLATSTFVINDFDEDEYWGYTPTPPRLDWNFYLEWKVTIHNSTGSVEVRVTDQGTPLFPAGAHAVIDESNIDTQVSGNASADTIALWVGGNAADPAHYDEVYWYYDDIYVCDGTGGVDDDFMGDSVIYSLFPNGAGSASDFTPGAGANWENVDEDRDELWPTNWPDDDDTYNYSTSGGDRDSYTLDDLALDEYGAVAGIQVCGYMKKTDAGALTARNAIRTEGAYFPGATISPANGTYGFFLDIWGFNPATSGDFDGLEIDVLEAGVERVT